MKKPIITAHAGADYTDPNTIESMEYIEKYGPDVIEADVNITDDGKIVMGHDKGDNKGSLESFLKFAKGKDYLLNLDIKDISALEGTAALIRELEMEDQCYFSGISLKNLHRASALEGEFSYLANIEPSEIELPKLYFEDYCMDILTEVKKEGAFGFNINYRMLTRTLKETASILKLGVYVWTVDHDMDIRHMIDMGVDSITTNNLKQVFSILSEGNRKYIMA